MAATLNMLPTLKLGDREGGGAVIGTCLCKNVACHDSINFILTLLSYNEVGVMNL